ncbi:MAG: excinuclease ABC subunit UvrB, partial [Candidatus Poribacteria bacterium]
AAQTNLGVMHDNGNGVPEDDAEAVRWYRLAAERGFAAARYSLVSRRDVIIVASVSCIYGIGSPEEFEVQKVEVKKGDVIKRHRLLRSLVDIQYERNEVDFWQGHFRARGDVIEVFPAYAQNAYRIELFGDEVDRITEIEMLTGVVLEDHDEVAIYPAKHFMTDSEQFEQALIDIEAELQERIEYFVSNHKLLEAQRIEQRTRFDLEMLREVGYCSGIENYTRHLSGLKPGEPPYCLVNYFPDDFLLFIDESHVSLPQLRGMYRGDRSRKEKLVDYGFRLPSALDNRPLRSEELWSYISQAIFVSATPGEQELTQSTQIVEQVIRPTGLIDPKIIVRPSEGQIDHLIGKINERIARNQRVLVTTLTKRMSEDLTDYLTEAGIKANYLHSDIDTLERPRILMELREGIFDVLVGINLLREGLDLPEVSLVAILDADRAGFLRSETSLIQIAGRAARNVDGEVILYADERTDAIQNAVNETARRRKIQEAYNKEHGITPTTIDKAIRDLIAELAGASKKPESTDKIEVSEDTSQEEIEALIADLSVKMQDAAMNLEFERAAVLRDQISELRREIVEN